MNGFIKEYVRLEVINHDGTKAAPVFVDISGPVVEAAKSLNWATQLIEQDGGKVTSVQFGTLQAGEFRERLPRTVPLFVAGWRRMSHILRA